MERTPPTPIVERVNGYDLMQVKDGFGVWNSDHQVAGPFKTLAEARKAAEQLPSREPPTRKGSRAI